MAKGGKGGKGGKGPGAGGAGGGLSGSTIGLIALFAGLALVLGGIAVADQMGVFGSSSVGDCQETLTGRAVHEHAELLVYLDSDQPFDFSPQKYQVQTGFVHFENGREPGPDTTVHIHEARPTIGCVFTTLDWQVSEGKIVTDTGETYESPPMKFTVKVDGEETNKGLSEPLIGNKRYEIRFESTDDAQDTDSNTSGNQTLGLIPSPLARFA